MNFKLFLCKLGFHKWEYRKRPILHYKDTIRNCIKCEKIQINYESKGCPPIWLSRKI